MSLLNNQNSNIRISLTLSSIILIGLLISKFTGYDSLFSYRAPSLGTKQYSSGIMLINKFLQNPEQSDNLLIQGKEYISQSLSNLKEKKITQQISGEIQQLTAVELYNETKECLSLFITGFNLLEDIKEKFLITSNNVTNIESTMKQRATTLPSSSTKKCLELYISSLNTSKEGLSLAYNNITSMNSLYVKSLSGYREAGGGFCGGVKEFIDSSIQLKKTLDVVIKTTELVQKKLDSFDLQEYNSLCKYGGIQGLENIQKDSRSAKNRLDSFIVNLKKTNNIKDYIKTLVPNSGS